MAGLMGYYRMYCAELNGRIEPCHGVRFTARDIREEVGGNLFLDHADRKPCADTEQCIKECWRVAKSYGWRVVPVKVEKMGKEPWPNRR